MAEPKDTVPSLQKVANFHGEYSRCPHLTCGRPGQCVIFRRDGAAGCFRCGFDAGLDAGYEMGHMDGYVDGRYDGLESFPDEHDESSGGMD